MSGLKRVRRWVVPVSAMTMALAGLVLLAAEELVEAPRRGAPRAASRTPEAPAPRATAAVAPPPRTVERAAPAAARPAPVSPRSPQPAAPPPVRPLVRETPDVLRASRELTALAQAPDLLHRLQLLDALVAGLPPDEAVRVLGGLLDSELPGDFFEAESLRLALLGKVADHRGGQADGILLERLAPARPRPERLAAVDALRAREAARGTLASIAAGDHDVVVQQRARWALQRTP